MLDRLFGFKVHQYLQALGLLIVAVGLPLNKVVMSIGTIWLASNLILDARFSTYWSRWKKSRLFWFIAALLLMHLIGLLYTENFSYAFRDINGKLPLFVIPISIVAFPISRKSLYAILGAFLVVLLITSLVNWSMQTNAADFRSLSLFGSHIRYTVLVAIGISCCVQLAFYQKKLIFIVAPLALWFIYYVYVSQVFAGYFALLMVVVSLIFHFIFQWKSRLLKYALVSILVLSVGVIGYQGVRYLKTTPSVNFEALPSATINGNPYRHDSTHLWYENGHHVLSMISEKELRPAWNKHSTYPYNGVNNNGHKIKHILFRYMASKGLNKDSAGFSKMTDQDIRNVEKGFTNIRQLSGSPLARMENFKNEYQQYTVDSNPNGNSFLQRLEHLRIGWKIAKDHWLIGVGTGDVQDSFDHYYKRFNTQLSPKNWNRTHNQLLTFWITFGLSGLLIFSWLWLWLITKSIQYSEFLALSFSLIALGTFMSEDTIETQQGVTFIAFFLAIVHLLFQYNENQRKSR